VAKTIKCKHKNSNDLVKVNRALKATAQNLQNTEIYHHNLKILGFQSRFFPFYLFGRKAYLSSFAYCWRESRSRLKSFPSGIGVPSGKPIPTV